MKKPPRRPSTIFGSAASGLPSLRLSVSSVWRSCSTTSAGTSSRRQVLRPGEGDVHGDVVGQLGGGVGHLDEHGVDAAAALDVQVACRAGCRRRPRCARPRRGSMFSLSVIFRSSSSLARSATASSPLAATSSASAVGLGLELVAAGDEVGLALQLDDRPDVAVERAGRRRPGRSRGRRAWRWRRGPSHAATAWRPPCRRRWPRGPSWRPSSRRRWPGAAPGRPWR